MIREIISVLFPYIVVLYVIDSLQYVKKSNLLFVSHFGKNFHLKANGLYLTKLSPVSTTTLSHHVPAVLAASGLYKMTEEELPDAIISNEKSVQFISFKNIHEIDVEGKNVNINGSTFFRAPSPITADIFKEKIKAIKILKAEKRGQKIKENIKAALDIEKIKERNRLCARDLTKLKLLCVFFFVNTFMVLPLILYTYLYLYINIYLIVAYIGLAYMIIVMLTLSVHRKFYKREKRQRLHLILSMIFSPFSAAHAANYITNDLYSHFHPLAIAGILLPAELFENMVRKELALIELRKRLVKDAEWLEYWEIMETAIKDFFEDAGCSVQQVLAPPAKTDDRATCYCPVCLAEYVGEIEYCSDCGIKLSLY